MAGAAGVAERDKHDGHGEERAGGSAGCRGVEEGVVGVGVTGVAGPDGGSDAKPVGLVYVAVAGGPVPGAAPEVRRFLWPGDRSENKRTSAEAAITMLLERATAPEPA